jgi:phosphatidylglycerol:prolipoprotein diacylglycerol transferase
MNGYGLWVLLGICAGLLVRRLQPAEDPALQPHRPRLLMAAVIGAVGGAYLLQLPADWFGWDLQGGERIGGRTVLGGLLGGWLAVEFAKWLLGVRQPTGDGFATPLAAALACGRMGCIAGGCCGGVACDYPFAVAGRWPVAQVEVGFHLLACVVLLVAARKGWWPGRRLAAYLTLYAVLRLALEGVRGHPTLIAGLTWYQLLASLLFLLAGSTWLIRSVRTASPGASNH